MLAASTLATAAALAWAGSASSPGQVAPPTCGASAEETRWISPSYSQTHTYGLGDNAAGPDQWIGSYGGLVAAGDTLFLYDQSRPRIVQLSGELEERHAFGRAGDGPGEFNMPFPVTWIDDIAEGHVAFDGRHLVVYDRHDFALFDAEGTLRWSSRIPLPTLSMGDGVRFVSPLNEEEIIFGLDSLDARSRRLQLWKLRQSSPNDRELLWERPIPWRGREAEPYVTPHRREARSYWARHRDCVVVSDGGRHFLWMIDLSTLEPDSLSLPEWEVPEFGELPSDRRTLRIASQTLEAPNQGPALLKRWTGLIVDPDGHAWVGAWTQSEKEHQAFVVSLASGRYQRLDLPAFPTAFGAPGVFYAAQRSGRENLDSLLS